MGVLDKWMDGRLKGWMDGLLKGRMVEWACEFEGVAEGADRCV